MSDSPLLPDDALAALVIRGRGYLPPRIDSDGWPVAVELPSPESLAARWILPRLRLRNEVYRQGAALVLVPPGGGEPRLAPFPALVEVLRRRLAELPDRADARQAYRDLRLFASAGGAGLVAEYLEKALRKVRDAVSALPTPGGAQRQRREPLPPVERAARRQEAERERQQGIRDAVRRYERPTLERAAEWSLEWKEGAEPGAHPARTVFTQYTADEDPPVGRNRFYTIADSAIGERKRRASGPVYVVAEEDAMTREQRKELASIIIDRLVAEWREESHAGLDDIIAERGSASTVAVPTSLPAGVVSLDAHRARRVA